MPDASDWPYEVEHMPYVGELLFVDSVCEITGWTPRCDAELPLVECPRGALCRHHRQWIEPTLDEGPDGKEVEHERRYTDCVELARAFECFKDHLVHLSVHI